MSLTPLRQRLDALRRAGAAARAEIVTLARRHDEIADAGERAALQARIEALRADVARARGAEALDAHDAAALACDPRQWMGELDGRIPILLAPLRLQSRFDFEGLPRLCLRAYPDDFSIDAHEPALQPDEAAEGLALWAAPAQTDDPGTATQKAVFRAIASRRGIARASWIRQATRPGGAPPEVGQGGRVPATWTLPERLLFRVFADDGAGEVLVGEFLAGPIPDGLEMGLDATRPGLGFSHRDEGRLDVPQELRWLVDFEQACAVGLGIAIPLQQLGARRAFSRIVALGVRLSSDEADGAARIESLLLNHQYGVGLSLPAKGTPTNAPPAPAGDARTAPQAAGAADAAASAAAIDEAFERLVRPAAGRERTTYDRETDGQRLAHALGIDPGALHAVEGADRLDGAEAIAMKRVLWAGSFGYYAHQMLWPMFDDPAEAPDTPYKAERLASAARFHFTHFVSGRGPLPALRVGDQPYGVLPVAGDMLQPQPQRLADWDAPFLDDFGAALHGKLVLLATAWADQVPGLARVGAPGAGARLLEILSLQAGAASLHCERLIGSQYVGMLASLGQPGIDPAAYAQSLAARRAAFQKRFPGLLPWSPRVFDLAFFGAAWRRQPDGTIELQRDTSVRLDGDLVDDRPLSEQAPIRDGYPNYLAELASLEFERLRAGLVRRVAGPDGGVGDEAVTALLYIAVRHSLLHEYAFAAMRLHVHLQQRRWGEFLDKELYNALYELDPTTWDLLEQPAYWPWQQGLAAVRPIAARRLIEGRGALVEMLPEWPRFFGDIEQAGAAMHELARLPTARLARLFAEHLDLASYRIDAWITGLVASRLQALRCWRDDEREGREHPLFATPRDRDAGRSWRYDLNHRPIERHARGLYLGAYGWLEDVRADAPGTAADDLPAELRPQDGRAVRRDSDALGLIHAPSLDQAHTAALLRAASVAEPGKPQFGLELSSARVRDALDLIGGVREGQSTPALLGYRFERLLRDRHPALQQWLPQLRTLFPMPHAEPDAPLDGAAVASAMPGPVVNGLTMVQARRDGQLAQRLAGALPAPAGDAVAGIVDAIADTFDACSDLMLAEAVHQAALGRHERARGVITSAGDFDHLPLEFEVIRTPGGGRSVTQRLLLALPDAAARADAGPRARLEPRLDAWIASVIGAPAALACGLRYVLGAEADAPVAGYRFTLGELELDAIDLPALLADGCEGEFAARADRLLRARLLAERPGATVHRVELDTFVEAGPGEIALGERLPVIEQLAQLLGRARAATLRDWLPPSALRESDGEGIDAAAVRTRALAAIERCATLKADLSDLVAQAGADAALLDVARATLTLREVSRHGLPDALPVPGEPLAALRDRAAGAAQALHGRIEAAQAVWDVQANKPPKGSLRAALADWPQALWGSPAWLLPLTPAPAGLADAELPAAAADALAIEDALCSAAAATPGAASLQRLRVTAAALAEPLPPLRALQWPTGLPGWLAAPEGVAPPGGGADAPAAPQERIGIVVQPSAAFDAAQPLCALALDEWHELVPDGRQITGVAFHADAAGAEPPQTLLLAVSERAAQARGRWSWDELVRCADQTLALAKLRAVSPDELRQTELDAVLPATLAAESAMPATINALYTANVAQDVALIARDAWADDQ